MRPTTQQVDREYEEWLNRNSGLYLLRKSKSPDLTLVPIVDKHGRAGHRWEHPHDNPGLMHKEAHVTVLRLKGWDGSLKELAEKAKDIYKNTLQGKELTNLDTGEKIRFSQEGKTESFGGIKHQYDAEIVLALGRVVRRAIHIDSEPPDHRKKERTKAMHTMVSPLAVNGQLLTVKLTLREANHSAKGESSHKFYDVAVLKMPVRSIGIGVAPSEGDASPTAHEHTGKVSVADMVSVFKGDNERHIPKPAILKSIKPRPQNDMRKGIRFQPLLIKSRKLDGGIDFNGLDCSIETGRSRNREWHNPHDGSQGMSRMLLPYGYVRGTLGTDGDHVDVFVGPDRTATHVYVIHTTKAPEFNTYDEDKCILGVASPQEAYQVFTASYSEPRFFGEMSIWPFDEFKEAVYRMKGQKLEKDHKWSPGRRESESGVPHDDFVQAEIVAGKPISLDELKEAAERGMPMTKATPFVHNVREAWQAVTKAKGSEEEEAIKKSGEALCKQLGDSMGIDWKRYDLDEFCDGMFDEQEHADVVDHDDTKIARIVLEHLDEDRHYYSKMVEIKKMGLLKARAGIRY